MVKGITANKYVNGRAGPVSIAANSGSNKNPALKVVPVAIESM